MDDLRYAVSSTLLPPKRWSVINLPPLPLSPSLPFTDPPNRPFITDSTNPTLHPNDPRLARSRDHLVLTQTDQSL